MPAAAFHAAGMLRDAAVYSLHILNSALDGRCSLGVDSGLLSAGIFCALAFSQNCE
jgi:hypothetical protein